ncbi:unnamed protein product [Allacma fusca]|uniref:Protein arginine N-methyltransferase 7 n=1 Tax=Allacma fusca TaxID=39272 RepID=A0A8J2PSD6_9HEXA|nr:unnamed protein product [Allacma fusca]
MGRTRRRYEYILNWKACNINIGIRDFGLTLDLTPTEIRGIPVNADPALRIWRFASMGMQPAVNFVQKFNPTKNTFEWEEQPEQYDFFQEIARSAYADMLHDFDRNQKYERALALAIKKVQGRGEKAVVLDIGTGTGLLSMMAVRHGADTVYACEAFEPMAKCASQVIKRNGCAEKIKLIPKRSTDLQVGPGKDMDTRANILVTEVYDTELIGEGAIETFNHAHEFLLEDGCQVIPHAAEIYAMVVDCPTVDKWNVIQPVKLPDGPEISFPESISKCSGVPSVHDLQLSELNPNLFTPISSPLKVFDFNYTEHNQRTPDYRRSLLNFQSEASGKCGAVFTWWLLIMDPEGEIVITMQPEWWNKGNEKFSPTWKDHWMQCAYYLPEPCVTTKGQNLVIEAFHDEFSLWYQINPVTERTQEVLNHEVATLERPICECGVHTTLSRSRIGMLNDDKRNSLFISVLQKYIRSGESVCLVLSEGSLLPLFAACMGAKKVFVLEEHRHSAHVMKQIVHFNGLDNIVTVIHKKPDQVTQADLNDLKVNIVIGDPFFHSSILPWNNLYFWYAKEALRWSFEKDIKIIPSKAYLKGIAVEFQDLHHIKAPVNVVKSCDDNNCGYDIQDFDNLVLRASDLTDHRIDAQPLWEYKGRGLSEEINLATIDLTQPQIIAHHDPVPFQKFLSPPNGIALWMDWQLDEDIIVANGPLAASQERLSAPVQLNWDMNLKQGVFFTRRNDVLDTTNIDVKYIVNSGDVDIWVVTKTWDEDKKEYIVKRT